MLQLKNKSTNKGLWLVEQKYSIGSDSESDIKILGNAQAQHAEIQINGDQIELINLVGSGVSLDGKPIDERAVLKAGNVISIGGTDFEVLDPKTTKKPAAKPAEPVGWSLKALNTALEDKHFTLSGTQTIGRSQDCDVSLGVVHLSRKHAKLTVTDRGLVIEDLNSSNGTYINGKKISKGNAVSGDEIAFDTLRFRVIGPAVDDDRTALRSSGGGDLTTIRPALNMSHTSNGKKTASAKPGAGAASQGSAKPKTKPTKSNASHKPNPQVLPSSGSKPKKDDDSKGYGMLIVAILVVVGAAVGWFMMNR